jgi:hypothetical protein
MIMDLVTLREQFIKMSGRYDLVIDSVNWADSGANFYINAGQNMLDRAAGISPEVEGHIWKNISINDYYITFQNRCRSIFTVYVNNTEERVLIEKKSLDEMKDLYSKPLSEVDTGSPKYYCIAKLREIDAVDKDKVGVFANVSLTTSNDFRGIVLYPPADTDYVVEIFGMFYQLVLTNDTDENFWTILHPELLIKAALYQVELYYSSGRKTQGLFEDIHYNLMEINKDALEEKIYGIDKMEG